MWARQGWQTFCKIEGFFSLQWPYLCGHCFNIVAHNWRFFWPIYFAWNIVWTSINYIYMCVCVYIVFWMYLLILQLGLSWKFCHMFATVSLRRFKGMSCLEQADPKLNVLYTCMSYIFHFDHNLKLASLLSCKHLFDFFVFAAEWLHSPTLWSYFKLFHVVQYFWRIYYDKYNMFKRSCEHWNL